MKVAEIAAKMVAAAREMAAHDQFGALHICVSDGNWEDENIEYCLTLPGITAQEAAFARRMLSDFTEAQRLGAWALTDATDIGD